MRLSTPFSILLALPALSSAEVQAQQKPLRENIQSWLSAAQSYLPTAAQAYLPSGAKSYLSSTIQTTPIASPEAAATTASTATATLDPAAAAAASITPLTSDNWRTVLSPSPSRASPDLDGRETWMVLVSGGNKTCLGHCEHLEAEWNKTAALLSADPLIANIAPRLGYVNCDASPVLCATWGARPITLWHIQFPAVHVNSENDGSSSSATPPSTETTVRIISLNMTSTTAEDLLHIHSQKTYETAPVYDSFFHPFDGLLAKNGIAVPVGYVVAGFSLVPTWVYMIVISFVSRNFM